jgi:hypothetical protein
MSIPFPPRTAHQNSLFRALKLAINGVGASLEQVFYSFFGAQAQFQAGGGYPPISDHDVWETAATFTFPVQTPATFWLDVNAFYHVSTTNRPCEVRVLVNGSPLGVPTSKHPTDATDVLIHQMMAELSFTSGLVVVEYQGRLPAGPAAELTFQRASARLWQVRP